MTKAKTSYSEKLRDPRWQKKRLYILERDKFTCQECKKTENELHVHHRSYQFGLDPWDYEDHQLVTLCKGCHNDRTTADERLKELTGKAKISSLKLLLDLFEEYFTWESQVGPVSDRISNIDIAMNLSVLKMQTSWSRFTDPYTAEKLIECEQLRLDSVGHDIQMAVNQAAKASPTCQIAS